MRWFLALTFLLVAFADPALAQPVAANGHPVKAYAAAKPPAVCQLQRLAGDNAGLASAKLLLAAQQAGLSKDAAARALLVAFGIHSSCTNTLHSPSLFNGALSAS